MKYKYKRTQIFRKELPVPENIKEKVYKKKLSIHELLANNLEDKIPISCLHSTDRELVEKFGLEKFRNFDWELMDRKISIKSFDILNKLDPNVEDLTSAVYEKLKDIIEVEKYTTNMRSTYPERFFEINDDDIEKIKKAKEKFNSGKTKLPHIFYNWDFYKDKYLGKCLENDYENENFKITDEELKNFMEENKEIISFVRFAINPRDIYSFVKNFNTWSEEEKQAYLKNLAEKALKENYKYTNDDYKEIFKYYPMTDFIKNYCQDVNQNTLNKVIEEIKTLPNDYILNSNISPTILNNRDALAFISEYGLKNIIDFDNEEGHFFSNNDCEVLKIMYPGYMNHANFKFDIDYHSDTDPYTLDEFYQVMKKMLTNGFTDRSLNIENPYYGNITGKFRELNPELFLDDDAPEELKNVFYRRQIDSDYILNHREYHKYLRKIDLSLIYGPIKTTYDGRELTGIITDTFGKDEAFDVMLLYGKYLKEIEQTNYFGGLNYHKEFTKDQLLDILDNSLLLGINNGDIEYYRNTPTHFRNNYPTLFLDDSVSKDIRDKFYSRSLTVKDFEDNLQLIESFKNTNLVYGFNKDFLWMHDLFKDNEDGEKSNQNRLKIIEEYSKITDTDLKQSFRDYINKHKYNFDLTKVKYVGDVLKRLSSTNSTEMFRLKNELADSLLELDNPVESLDKIEDIFLKNAIPTVGKVYYCFETLHPNFKKFNFDNSPISPVLKHSGNRTREIVVFSDLIRASLGSNNKSINEYLTNIEEGSNLYTYIKDNNIQYTQLDSTQKQCINYFGKCLATLYNNTKKGKTNEFDSSEDIISDIDSLVEKLSPNDSTDYNLPDRLTRMFCGFAGIDTLDEAKTYINSKVQEADKRNRAAANSDMTLENGDLVKGIVDTKYLRNILQNGSVAKEFLGSNAGSDRTPLDTDLCMITTDEGTVSQKIENTEAGKHYGNTWLILKNDDRFILTRDSEKEYDYNRKDFTKLELFNTGVVEKAHYGIRTGFASTEINYIVMEKYNPTVGIDIVTNGFYIPVVNKEGKVVFSPKDYDDLREKMSGLSYYGENDFKLSENLINPGIVDLAEKQEKSSQETAIKRNKINEAVANTISNLGLDLKTEIDGDISEGIIELIDTGSTGRGTNKPGEGDFDFLMRVDKSIINNEEKLNELREALLTKFQDREKSQNEQTGFGDLRLKKVKLDEDTTVDIDITFIEKSDKIDYSSDMAVRDRLDTIKNNNPEQYAYVVANILEAKSILKEGHVYKSSHSPEKEGGLGGIGIENWILQNGGSLEDAAKSFLKAAEGKTFEEFQQTYQIWDFGDNHLAERRGMYPHDNFVKCNMNEEGYKKMIPVLQNYLINCKMAVNTDNLDSGMKL